MLLHGAHCRFVFLAVAEPSAQNEVKGGDNNGYLRCRLVCVCVEKLRVICN